MFGLLATLNFMSRHSCTRDELLIVRKASAGLWTDQSDSGRQVLQPPTNSLVPSIGCLAMRCVHLLLQLHTLKHRERIDQVVRDGTPASAKHEVSSFQVLPSASAGGEVSDAAGQRC